MSALSSRQELSPRGIDAGTADKLSQGVLCVASLTVEKIRERVKPTTGGGRVAGRPELDSLCARPGFEIRVGPVVERCRGLRESFDEIRLVLERDTVGGTVGPGTGRAIEAGDEGRSEDSRCSSSLKTGSSTRWKK